MISRAKSMIAFRRRDSEKSNRYKLDNGASVQHMVSQILMSELRDAYTEIEDQHVQLHRSRLSLKVGGADYSWLISSKFASSKVPTQERTELERLCEQVKTDECNTCISYFRARLDRCQRGADVVQVFKTTLVEVIKSRPKPVDAGAWLSSRIRRSRSSTNRIDSLADACSKDESSTTQMTGSHYSDGDRSSTKNMMELV